MSAAHASPTNLLDDKKLSSNGKRNFSSLTFSNLTFACILTQSFTAKWELKKSTHRSSLRNNFLSSFNLVSFFYMPIWMASQMAWAALSHDSRHHSTSTQAVMTPNGVVCSSSLFLVFIREKKQKNKKINKIELLVARHTLLSVHGWWCSH